MTETNETSNQNKLDLTDLKYHAEIINGLNSAISNSCDFLLPKYIREVAEYSEVSMVLEAMNNIYPAMNMLLVDLQKQIDELPEYVEVANHEL
ncbi:hypothetical protein ABU186_08780 [Weissella paramesenteroides]